jgi:hypothetical protein
MSSPEKLYSKAELRGIKDEDKEVLHRELQHLISTDPIVRTIMIAHKGVHDRPDNDSDPTVRAIKHFGRGMKEYLKEKLQPVYDGMKSGK